MRTIVDHASSSVADPSLNVRCTSLTKSSHLLLTISFLRVTSCIYPFKYSMHMPNGPSDLPPFKPLTSAATSASVGIPSSMSAYCTRSGTLRISGGLHLFISTLFAVTLSNAFVVCWACTPLTCLSHCEIYLQDSGTLSTSMSYSMDVPASCTCFCLSIWSAPRNSNHACLNSVTLALPTLWSAACLSVSFQVSWDIQDDHAVVGHCTFSTSTFCVTNAASPSISGCTVRDLIGQY